MNIWVRKALVFGSIALDALDLDAGTGFPGANGRSQESECVEEKNIFDLVRSSPSFSF